MNYYESLRKLLKKRRTELKMLQTEVAEKADISNNFYSNIERGRTKPSVDTLIKICKALDLSLDEIIFDDKITDDEIDIKDTIRSLNNIFKDKNEESIETMIMFCNAIIAVLNKIKKKDN